jgi:putative spermidine/putrescine transport system substrate-binding protein
MMQEHEKAVQAAESTDATDRPQDAGRRRVLRTALTLGAVGVAPAIWTSRSQAQARTLVVRDPAGPYVKAMTEAFYQPFEKAAGVRIERVTADHEPTSQVKAMVETKNYFWDVVSLSMGAYGVVDSQGLIEPLDWSGEMNEIHKPFQRPGFLAYDVASTAIVYSIDRYGDKGPQSWAEFWDVERFKGRRAMRRHPFDTLEEALMADGVPVDKVYPLDLPRAFKSLDRVKPHVAIWWTGGAQASQLIKSGEVDLIATWNGRAQAAIDDGAKYRISWNEGIAVVDGLCVPKGSPKAALAKDFIKFCANAQRQAVFSQHIAYGPTNPNAFKHIAADRAAILPSNPKYLPNLVLQTPEAWAAHKDKATEMFDAWVTAKS